jgi:glucose-1-phosphate thymidylyltransferase
MKGQSDALWLAREHLSGAVIICFSDTLMETDFSFLGRENPEAVAWVKPVPDPRRFGVAELDADGWVRRLIEKPQSMENNLVVVGCYYFRDSGKLLTAIEEQIRRGTSLKGEYFLTDAINIMIEHGMKMRTQNVAVWLDTGTIQATLETNRYLLEHGRENAANHFGEDVKIIRPVFIHPTAEVTNSTIGPHVSVAADCKITNAHVEDSIVESGTTLEAAALKGCYIGRRARVAGRSADDPPLTINIGDDSSVMLK